jgi:hypothetical protein
MKRILIAAACASLAACSPAETTDEAAAPAETAEVATEVTAADGGPPYGMFKVTQADGTVSMEEVREDGTYTSKVEGEEPTTGKWQQTTSDAYCTTSDEEGAVEKCYAETVDEKGIWTSTDPDDGKVSTIERVTT